jgi:hypothetical protein
MEFIATAFDGAINSATYFPKNLDFLFLRITPILFGVFTVGGSSKPVNTRSAAAKRLPMPVNLEGLASPIALARFAKRFFQMKNALP